ncbi:hypothetical protein RO3G_05408 [Rhizopus delemar RA 99-880]|uniref:Uncharacterized protein n=1 Tax=Rhizopus delemar (strain RA 99-880 / ATCC MYA-4621 / FGSC 9543 / NRRL 43880) TaxID=246409 RepID=I1BWX3_RHIO9|nr:hypothetical protein RO3G_05408 [Rhizopus delemar RA 99-880]|eukprot:EIE80703.1 hypothetical protein RO3G_05408 [Rhizopus delemar RA 99-880]
MRSVKRNLFRECGLCASISSSLPNRGLGHLNEYINGKRHWGKRKGGICSGAWVNVRRQYWSSSEAKESALSGKDGGSTIVSGNCSQRCILRQWIEWEFVGVCEGWTGHGLGVPPGSHLRRQHTQRFRSILVIGSHKIGSKEIIGQHNERSVELRQERF